MFAALAAPTAKGAKSEWLFRTIPNAVGTPENTLISIALCCNPAGISCCLISAARLVSESRSKTGKDNLLSQVIINASRSIISSNAERIASSSVGPHANPLLVV